MGINETGNICNYAYFGHHKSASTSTAALIYSICNTLGIRPVYSKTAFEEHPENLFQSNNRNFLISVTSTYNNIHKYGQFKGFHIIRDPRDICVSGYFSHLHSHKVDGWPKLKEHRKELSQLNLEDGLYKEFEFTDFVLQHMAKWNYMDSNILELKMEDYIKEPFLFWKNILIFLDLYSETENLTNIFNKFIYQSNGLVNRCLKYTALPKLLRLNNYKISEYQLKKLLTINSFEKLSQGRNKGAENIQSHYRKGTAADWKNYFSHGHIEYFKSKYGDLLIQLGYEQDYDW